MWNERSGFFLLYPLQKDTPHETVLVLPYPSPIFLRSQPAYEYFWGMECLTLSRKFFLSFFLSFSIKRSILTIIV